ncbi:MAG: hypothetical protein INR73_09290 [Williamsia sp.]|nr:hypothetical protein [Williamsia sp.]
MQWLVWTGYLQKGGAIVRASAGGPEIRDQKHAANPSVDDDFSFLEPSS